MQMLPISKIRPSTTNPRKHFDEKSLSELTESIRKHGILQPILVREAETPVSGGPIYEIVAGERRYRSAKDAGLKEIPAKILVLTDIEAVEIQVIENLQRADLHPLEEAEGYEALMKKHGYGTADEIAAKIGKSRAYVYGRMKLCALTPDVKKVFLKGTINASVALLLARVPESLQEKAAKTVLNGKYGEGPLSYRDASAYLKDHFTLTLSGAPFDTKDAKLCPGLPACSDCPKRTGNEPELFLDIKGADVCTDPDCFKAKTERAWEIKTLKKSHEGHVILSPQKSRGIFYGTDLNRYDYVLLMSVCEDDKKRRTYRELLPAIQPADIVIAMDGKGKPRELLKRDRALELLTAAGHKFAETRAKEEAARKSSYREPTPEEKAAKERLEKIQESAYETAMTELQEKLASGAIDHRKALLAYAVAKFSNEYVADSIYRRHGFKTREQFDKRLRKMPVTSPLNGEGDGCFRKLIGMLLESVVSDIRLENHELREFFQDFSVNFQTHLDAADTKAPETGKKAKKK